MAEVSVLTDVPGQTEYSTHQMIVNDIPAMIPMLMLRAPWHFLSKNVFGYENEDAHDWLLQQVFDYGDLFLPFVFYVAIFSNSINHLLRRTLVLSVCYSTSPPQSLQFYPPFRPSK